MRSKTSMELSREPFGSSRTQHTDAVHHRASVVLILCSSIPSAGSGRGSQEGHPSREAIPQVDHFGGVKSQHPDRIVEMMVSREPNTTRAEDDARKLLHRVAARFPNSASAPSLIRIMFSLFRTRTGHNGNRADRFDRAVRCGYSTQRKEHLRHAGLHLSQGDADVAQKRDNHFIRMAQLGRFSSFPWR